MAEKKDIEIATLHKHIEKQLSPSTNGRLAERLFPNQG